jgi:hypothetical protein
MMQDTGLLSEHESRESPQGAGADYTPSPDEKKLIKQVERLFDKAKKHRAQYDQEWLDNYHFFRGKQWKEQRPSYRHSEVINFVFRTIQTLVPIQTDARPRFEFLPEEPSDYELSIIMNEASEADWTKKNWQTGLLEVVYDANLYGAGLSEVCVDKRTTAIKYKSIDPFHCFPDPNATDVNEEAGYFITAVPTDTAKIKKDYPDKKEFIKADLQDMMKGSKTDTTPLKFRSPVDQKVVLEGGNSIDLTEKDKALLITCWMTPEYCEDDYEEREKVMQDPETGAETREYEQIAKFPQGRKVVICNGVLLEDGPNPYEDGKIPFQRYVNYLLPREFWGISEVEQIKGPQKMFNKVFSFALDVLTLMGNPIWLIPTKSGVDPENLVNRPGLNVEYDNDSPPTRQEGVQLQPYVLQIADKLAEWIDSTSGSQDVTRGVQPTGVTAASAITALQESANTRVRLKARIMDGYLQQVGQAWASRLFQFRTAPELFRLTNEQGASKYFRMHVEPTTYADPQTGAQVEGKKVVHQPYLENGQIDPTQAKEFQTRAIFDCRVSTGSSLPFNKAEKEQRLLAYFDRQIIDAEEVLKGSEYPNFEAVLARMEQKKMQEAQMAAQQQGAGGNSGNSAPPPAA